LFRFMEMVELKMIALTTKQTLQRENLLFPFQGSYHESFLNTLN